MKLVRTTIFSAIITFVRIASGFVAGKIIAIFTGPLGVALIGAFSNFIAIILTFANGAINNGIIKYTAEYDGDNVKLQTLFSTGLKISIACSAIIGCVLILCGGYFSVWVLSTEIYANVIRVLGLTIILYSLNSLLISILNGKGQIKTLTIVNAIGSIVGLLFTVLLVFIFRVDGALYALVLAQSIVFFFTAYLVSKSPWFSWAYFKEPFNKLMAGKLSHYSIMAIVSALTVPISQIILRNLIMSKLGINSAGFWQGMMRISDGYLMIITTSLATYYLPKLASITNDKDIRSEILRGYKLILPAILLGCSIIYFFRFLIIKILYTDQFLQMEGLFLWQLVGDFFKMSAWVLSYLLLAKAMTKAFIITEIVFSFSYVILGYLFVGYVGLIGITLAFALNYIFYLVTMLIIFRKLLFKTND